jgi:hypothetical protein
VLDSVNRNIEEFFAAQVEDLLKDRSCTIKILTSPEHLAASLVKGPINALAIPAAISGHLGFAERVFTAAAANQVGLVLADGAFRDLSRGLGIYFGCQIPRVAAWVLQFRVKIGNED